MKIKHDCTVYICKYIFILTRYYFKQPEKNLMKSKPEKKVLSKEELQV